MEAQVSNIFPSIWKEKVPGSGTAHDSWAVFNRVSDVKSIYKVSLIWRQMKEWHNTFLDSICRCVHARATNKRRSNFANYQFWFSEICTNASFYSTV